MRSTLTTSIVAVAVLAGSAGSAAANPHVSPNQIDAANHAAAMRSQGLHQRLLDGDQSTVVSAGQPAPVPIVRVTRAADGSFDWVDAGIGAGLSAALLLGAAGVASVRRRPTLTAH